MQTIPIANVPAQILNVTLGGQACTINIYTLTAGLFLDLLVNDDLIIGGVICQNLNRIVRNTYLGFIGDLIWEDTQGVDDPSYPGLGTRFILIYLELVDLAGQG